MSPEPDPKTEALLKGYAEKRRAQAGDLRMHEATRRLLQAEVRRQYAQGREMVRHGWLGTFLRAWPRLALAGVVVISIGVALWSIRDRSEFQMARNDAEADVKVLDTPHPSLGKAPEAGAPSLPLKEKSELSLANQPAPSTIAGQEVMLKQATESGDAVRRENRSFYVQDRKEAKDSSPAGVPSPVTLASSPRDRAAQAGSSGGAQPVDNYGAIAPAKPPSAPAVSFAPAEPLAFQTADAVVLLPDQKGAAERSRALVDAARPSAQNYFRNVAFTEPEQKTVEAEAVQVESLKKAIQPTTAKSTANSPVLSSFQVNQLGSSLQIVDADGSVYEGRIAAAPADGEPPSKAQGPAVDETSTRYTRRQVAVAAEKAAALSTLNEQSQAQSMNRADVGFEVYGTNRSLKKSVSMTGSLVLGSNQIQVVSATAQGQAAGTAGNVQQQGSLGVDKAGVPVTNSIAPQQVLRVIGRAKLDGTNELIIDAVPEYR